MAYITLMEAETKPGALPCVCCRCGMPADEEKEASFSWFPKRVFFLLIQGWLICIIGILVMRQRKTVYLPVCSLHNTFWKGPELLILNSLVGSFVGNFGVLFMMSGDDTLKNYVGTIMLVSVGWVIISLIIYFVWREHYVQTTQVDYDEITLRNLHPDFVAAVTQDRIREQEEFEAYRQARRASAPAPKPNPDQPPAVKPQPKRDLPSYNDY